MPDEAIRLPGPTHKTAIVGRTGSGKTVAAVWHLSNSDFDERPWIILDYKNDELINRIARAEVIGYGDIPDDPGIYILKVLPGDEEKVSEWFRQAWQRENLGILIDEGYMIDPRDQWFNACLTQGRSKRISMIILSQRPVWLSRFVFSEADFFQVFDLTHVKDMDKVREYVRDDERQQLDIPLEDYNSFYYDVGRKRLETFGPVPDQETILQAIDDRLAEMERLEELEIEPEDRPRRRAI
jgi:DNA helicase HerA-like ATPase